MRNFVQSRRLKALFALVFLSFVGVDVKAQDTVTVEYSHTFVRGSSFCPGTDQFDDWETFLDSIETLQNTGDFRFIEAQYNSTSASNSKTHLLNNAMENIEDFVTDLVSLDTLPAGGGTTEFHISSTGDEWSVSSGCTDSGVGACAVGATHPMIALAINPVNGTQCESDVESALRPFIGNNAWGGSFGDTILASGFPTTQSLSTEGEDETITFSISYVDAAPPVPVCFTDTVEIFLDNSGLFTLTSSHIDSASFDAFLNPDSIIGKGIEFFNLSATLMNCDSIGARNVVLTLIDSAGNDSSCVTVINVMDTIAPIIDPIHKTLFLDASGQASTHPDSLVNLVNENCGFGTTLTLSDTLFTCTGVFSDTIFGVDPSGNQGTAIAMVTVLDTVSPTAVCRADTFEVFLDAMGNVAIVADSLDGGSTDNVTCSNLTFAVDTMNFDCSNALAAGGFVEVELTVSDSSMNSSTCMAVVKVSDTIAPVVNIQDTVIVFLNEMGTATLDSTMVDISSSDSCGIAVIDLDTTNFACVSLDSSIFAFVRVGDVFDNFADEDSVLVIVRDTIAPVLDVNDTIMAYLDATGNFTLDSAAVDVATTDNCGGFTLELSDSLFDCANAGDTVSVTVTASDLDMETSVSTTNIALILMDTIDPIITTVALDTVFLDDNGVFMIHDTAFASAMDACGIMSIEGNVDSVTCADVAMTPITIISTATDSNGNMAVDSSMVLVLDTIVPELNVQNITVYLDENGDAQLDSNALVDSASDACGIDSFSVSMDSFNCSFINADNDSNVTVITTVVDVNGNTISKPGQVTIMDTIPPVVMAMDTTVQLDAQGMAIIDTSFVLASVTDNCASSLSFSLSQDTITCDDLFMVEVIVFVEDALGNVGSDTATVTVEDNIAPVAMAQNVTVYVDSMGQAVLNSQFVSNNVDNGSSDNCSFVLTVSDSIFDCSQEGLNLVTLTATDLAGNTGTDEFFVTVDDTIRPNAIGRNVSIVLNDNGTVSIDPSIIDSNSWDNCMDNLSFALSQTNFDCSNVGPNTIQFSVQDGNGQADTVDVVVTIIDKTLPTAISQNITAHLDANGLAIISAADVNNGSVDNCGIDTMWLSKDTLTCDDLGVSPLTLFVSDVDGNENSAAAIVTLIDTISPTVMTQTVTLQLNSNGNVPSITAMDFDNGSSDNCGFTAEILSSIDYDCSHIGSNDVSLRFVDGSGNETLATGTLIIEDTLAPTAMFNNMTVQLDAMGNAMVTPEMFDNGTADNCSNAPISLHFANGFTGNVSCSDIAASGLDVVLFAQDASLNTSDSVMVTLTIEDVTAPVLNTVDTTLSIDNAGNLTVMASLFDNGTSDACGIKSMTVSPSVFDCTNLGLNALTFTATDSNDLESTKTVYLTIQDDAAPVVVIADVTLQLDENGNTPEVTAAMFDNGTSDNCGFTAEVLNPSDFNCSQLGTHVINLRYSDNSGNVVDTMANVIIADTIAPVAMSQNITAYIDASGTATITPEMVNNGSTDNCDITLSLSNTEYPCFLAGLSQNVTLTVEDAAGNFDLSTAVVTIKDSIAPVVNVQAISRSLDANGTVTVTAADFNNGSSDNCGVSAMNIDMTSFDCSHVGNNTIVFTATDAAGNETEGVTTLTITDDAIPTVITTNITVNLNSAGNASITPAMIDNGSSDNCNFELTIDKSDFDCSNTGVNIVTLTATDDHGHTSSETAEVTIKDVTTPTINTLETYTVTLDATGNASIDASELNSNSSDNCATGDLTFHFSGGFNGNLNCSDIDSDGKPVYVFIKDAAGNISSSELTTVTIIDETAPEIVVNNISRSLGSNGTVSVTAADFDNGTNDACGIASIEVSPTTFDCSQVGVNALTFTATDNNGVVSNETVYLTVEDNNAPVVLTQDIDAVLDANGNVSINATMVDNGTTDNCNFTISIDKTNFDCADLGAQTVTLTATDANGLVSSGTAIVTVVDNVNPTAIGQNLTVGLDANGQAVITAAQVNNGSFDNCTSQPMTFALNKTTFDCTNVGTNNVELSVTDATGNEGTTIVVVTVEETMVPVNNTVNITKSLDANGVATVTAAEFDNGSTDNCGIASMVINTTSFDCSNLGLNTVDFTTTDVNGNVNTTQVFVTIEDNEAPVRLSSYLPFTGGGLSRTIGECDADGFEYNYPQFEDNCDIDNISLVSGLPSGSIFPVGTTTITYEASDASGNVGQVTFSVIVEALGIPTSTPTAFSGCIGGGDIDLTTTDFTFSGNGVNGNTFDAETAGVGSHSITWTWVDANGCDVTGQTVVNVNPAANMPVIEQTSSVILTAQGSGYSTYQWYKNGNLLSGENSKKLTINTAGDYHVRAFTANGCSSLSDVYDIGGGDYNSPEKGYDIAETTVYPNPSTGIVNVDLGEALESVTIEVFDARGAKLKTFNFENMTTTEVKIQLGELPSAMYHMVISSDVQVTTKKIVINK